MKPLILLFIISLVINSVIAQERKANHITELEPIIFHLRPDYTGKYKIDTLHHSDYCNPMEWNFEDNIELAPLIYENLKLEYVHYIDPSEKNEPIDIHEIQRSISEAQNSKLPAGIFPEHFRIASKIGNEHHKEQHKFWFEIDTTFVPTIGTDENLSLAKYVAQNETNGTITHVMKVRPDTLHNLNLKGQLKINMYYLVGYDTIEINQDASNRTLKINGYQFLLDSIDSGKLFISHTPDVPGLEAWSHVRFLTFSTSGEMISPRKRKRIGRDRCLRFFPAGFSGGRSQFDREALTYSDEEYIEYLKSLDSATVAKEDRVIIKEIHHNFDKIILYIPRYEFYKSKTLNNEVVTEIIPYDVRYPKDILKLKD